LSLIIPLAAALAHEGGHLVAMLLCRVPLKSIRITPAGIDIVHGEALSYRHENLCLAAGISVNLLLFVFSLPSQKNGRLSLYSLSHLTLALLNALPIPSLDGGRLLENLLLRFLSPYQAKRTVAIIGSLFLFFLWSAGIFLLLRTAGNGTLFFLCLYLFLKMAE